MTQVSVWLHKPRKLNCKKNAAQTLAITERAYKTS